MTRKVYLNFRLVQHYEYLAKIIPFCEEIIPKIIPPHLVIINPIVPVLCSIGDWFVLYQMSRNMNRYNTILKNLYYYLYYIVHVCFISPISRFLRPPCHDCTEHMVPRPVDKTKIDHGCYGFIALFFIISFRMIASTSNNLHLLTLCIYLHYGHNLLRSALITL